MNHGNTQRIVAIEARRSRFGYAVFEGPNKLMDWGASAVPSGLSGRAISEAARKRVVGALRRCYPEAAVVKRPCRTGTGKSATPSPIFKTILCETANMGMPMSLLTRADVREAFRSLGGRKKDDIAEILVEIFPELFARLPHKRMNKWKPEWRGMIVFDAVAAGFAYWQRMGSNVLPSET